MASKQLGKLRQWAGEVISSKDKPTIAEEFMELEKDIELRKEGAHRLYIASEAYEHALSKKVFCEALGDSDKLLPIDALGIVMISHGEEFPQDSDFGSSLVKFGRAHCKVATLQEAYGLTFKDAFMAAIESFKGEIREYEALRKKLESRKSALDSASARFEKLRASKKDKDRQEAEDEMDRAQQRYDETAEDMRAHMHEIQEKEISQQHELTHFLDLEINYVQQYLDVLREVREDWPDKATSTGRPKQRNSISSRTRPVAATPIRIPTPQGARQTTGDSSEDEADNEDNKSGFRFMKHRKSLSAGSRTPSRPPSRPSSRLSRKRTNSTARSVGDKEGQNDEEEKETTGRPRRFSTVADWASSMTTRGSKVKDKDSFATLDDEPDASTAQDGEIGSSPSIKRSGSFSLSRKLSRRKKSKENIPTLSPNVTHRILKPPSLQESKIVYALYDFNGSADELSFKAGTDIKVLNEVVDGWWMGEIGGKRGLFPTTHVSASPPKSVFPARIPKRNGGDYENLLSPPPPSAELRVQAQNEGYLTSDADEEFGYHQPMAHNRSPVYGTFNDVGSIASNDEGSPTVPHFFPRPRRFSDDLDLPMEQSSKNKNMTTPKLRTIHLNDGDSPKQPLISRATSDPSSSAHAHAPSGSPTKRVPPPPPPRRTASSVSQGASPAIPRRRLGPAATPTSWPVPIPNSTNGISTSDINRLRLASSDESMSATGSYDVSPFESAAELSSSAIPTAMGCGQFRQNPFQPQGMCSNCKQYHS